jgi:hypothetical protein
MRQRIEPVACALLLACTCACGNESPESAQQAPAGGGAGRPGSGNAAQPYGGAASLPESSAGAGAGGEPATGNDLGRELRIVVDGDTPTLVQLSTASEIEIAGDYRVSGDWDLAFQGWDLFTNGGASGSGKGAAFGPLPFSYFWAATEPKDVPFLIEDKAAGAFLDWYFYDGQWHALYSRFHAYGVKSGERWFKVQLLGYYGEVQGAPISGLYQLRYAEVTPEITHELIEVANLDATAGGLSGADDEPSACLTLGTGEQHALTPAAALASTVWDLCFRRDAITVNGGLGGPGGVTAVDLDAEQTAAETLDAIKVLTAEGEEASFAALDYDALTAPHAKYRGDRVVSAFSEAWLDGTARDATWLVAGADGKSRYLLAFSALEDSSPEAAGTVVMRIERVR